MNAIDVLVRCAMFTDAAQMQSIFLFYLQLKEGYPYV